MDKLQPLITHIFWILFGVALLLPTVGWWMGTGTLETRIAEQEGAIDGAFKEVPTNRGKPNDDWTKALQEINALEEQKYQRAALELQGTQNSLRTWHESIADAIAQIPYKDPIMNISVRERYRDQAYWEEIERLAKIVRPYDPATNAGLVMLTPASIPTVPAGYWRVPLPDPDEMWLIQEDIWLMRGLLKSIASVNEGANVVTESAVRQITSLTLHGGDRSALGQSASGSANKGGGEGNTFGGGGGVGAGQKASSIDIKPEAVFGPETAAASSSQSSDGEDGPMRSGTTHFLLGKDRYVDDEEGIPFQTRGFLLKVIMDHRKLPELLVALTNCEWPGQILHVNQVDLHGLEGAPSSSGPGKNIPFAGGGPFANQNFGGGFEAGDEAEAGMGEFDAGDFNIGPQPGPRRGATQGPSASAALADSYLAEVQIAGLLTIYDPPPADAVPADGELPPSADPAAGTGPAGPQAATGDPAANGQLPGSAAADGAANGTNPANPAGAANPLDPANSVNPADPANPANSTNPADPSHPLDPPDPGNPADAANPPNPGSPPSGQGTGQAIN